MTSMAQQERAWRPAIQTARRTPVFAPASRAVVCPMHLQITACWKLGDLWSAGAQRGGAPGRRARMLACGGDARAVKARAVASVVPGASIGEVASVKPPAPGTHRVERLKEDDYLRIWINKSGDHVLLHLPLVKGS